MQPAVKRQLMKGFGCDSDLKYIQFLFFGAKMTLNDTKWHRQWHYIRWNLRQNDTKWHASDTKWICFLTFSFFFHPCHSVSFRVRGRIGWGCSASFRVTGLTPKKHNFRWYSHRSTDSHLAQIPLAYISCEPPLVFGSWFLSYITLMSCMSYVMYVLLFVNLFYIPALNSRHKH